MKIFQRNKSIADKNAEISKKLRNALKKSPIKISCIIPAYNEETRILNVLEAIQDYDLFDEVILVNDGSKDNTSKVINEFLKKKLETDTAWVFIDNKNKNQGKTVAVLDGVNASNGNLLVLLDADLVGLSHLHIDKLLYYIVVEDYSMTILDRHTDRRGMLGWTAYTRFVGGERALWKKDFLSLDLPKEKRKGYLLEVIVNKYMMDNELSVITIFCEDLFTFQQTQKRSFISGAYAYTKMIWHILAYTKIRDTYRHFVYIDEDRIINLYDLNRRMRRKASLLVAGGAIATGIGLFLILNVKRFATNRKLKKLTEKRK